VVPALGVDEDLACAWRNVLAIADDLGIGLGRGHGAPDGTRVAVMEAAHAVIGVHEDARTCGHPCHRLLVGGVGVADGALHTHGGSRNDVLRRTRALRCERTLAYGPPGSTLPSLEDLDPGIDQEGGVLGTDVFHREEGSLEEDALDAGTHEVTATRLGRIGN